MVPIGQSARSMVILTCVDGALRESAGQTCAAARDAVAQVVARKIPVILTSYHSPGELMAVQHELQLDGPLIAGNGKALCIPTGYFARQPGLSTPVGGWKVMEFGPPEMEDAVEMLMWLYRASGDSPLLVGVGASWDDHWLLGHVDVPVIVKSSSVDQGKLRAHFPDAYVTSSAGVVGWREATLGSSLAIRK